MKKPDDRKRGRRPFNAPLRPPLTPDEEKRALEARQAQAKLRESLGSKAFVGLRLGQDGRYVVLAFCADTVRLPKTVAGVPVARRPPVVQP